jgi:hypothetical protein
MCLSATEGGAHGNNPGVSKPARTCSHRTATTRMATYQLTKCNGIPEYTDPKIGGSALHSHRKPGSSTAEVRSLEAQNGVGVAHEGT